jgi:hypothetical protein
MSNPNPRIENLELGRGQKPKLGHQSYKFNISPEDKDRLEMIAEAYGCNYAGKGSISALLAKIAKDELIIAPSTPYVPIQNNATGHHEREKKRKRLLDQDLLGRNKSKSSSGEHPENKSPHQESQPLISDNRPIQVGEKLLAT